jgi:peptide-methionine (R)-S-oxide reductase
MQRREFLKAGLLLASGLMMIEHMPIALAASINTLDLTDEQWRKKLTAQQYDILRHEATERPFTSALLHEHREGVYTCAGCDLELFSSKAKFDSGTGWPSFFNAVPNHIATKTDYSLIIARTEYHCARCGGHHGHLFNDGPKPTGLRYCSNGTVLNFIPA